MERSVNEGLNRSPGPNMASAVGWDYLTLPLSTRSGRIVGCSETG